MLGCRQYLRGSLFFSLCLDAPISMWLFVFQPILGCRQYRRGFFCFSAYAWMPPLYTWIFLFFSLCLEAAFINGDFFCFSAYAWMLPISMCLFIFSLCLVPPVYTWIFFAFQPLLGCRQYLRGSGQVAQQFRLLLVHHRETKIQDD